MKKREKETKKETSKQTNKQILFFRIRVSLVSNPPLTLSYSKNAILSSCVQFRPIGDTFIMPFRNSTKVPLPREITRRTDYELDTVYCWQSTNAPFLTSNGSVNYRNYFVVPFTVELKTNNPKYQNKCTVSMYNNCKSCF